MVQKLLKLRQMILKFVATPLCLGNISKDFPVDNMKKIGFYGYVYDFSVDYNATTINDILDIYKVFHDKA